MAPGLGPNSSRPCSGPALRHVPHVQELLIHRVLLLGTSRTSGLELRPDAVRQRC